MKLRRPKRKQVSFRPGTVHSQLAHPSGDVARSSWNSSASLHSSDRGCMQCLEGYFNGSLMKTRAHNFTAKVARLREAPKHLGGTEDVEWLYILSACTRW